MTDFAKLLNRLCTLKSLEALKDFRYQLANFSRLVQQYCERSAFEQLLDAMPADVPEDTVICFREGNEPDNEYELSFCVPSGNRAVIKAILDLYADDYALDAFEFRDEDAEENMDWIVATDSWGGFRELADAINQDHGDFYDCEYTIRDLREKRATVEQALREFGVPGEPPVEGQLSSRLKDLPLTVIPDDKEAK